MKTHGGDIYTVSDKLGVRPEDCLDFSANLNPLGIPDGVRKAMVDSLEQVVYYPDPDNAALIGALSRRYGVKKEYLTAGNGAADLIFRLVYAVKPERALLTAPTFLEYGEALKQAGTEVDTFRLNREFEAGEELLDCLDRNTGMIFLCNPNNPTGLLTDRSLIRRLAKKAEEQEALLVLDECFLDFTGREEEYTMVPYLEEFPNMIVLKSFTKMFAIPGIRLGYCLCSDMSLTARIKAAGQSWSVNTVAAAAGKAALEETEFVAKSAAFVKAEREYLTGELKKLGIRVIPGTANYLLIQAEKCYSLYEKLLPYGIIIRRCCNYDGLDESYYRIAVKRHEDNRKLVGALNQMIKGENE